MKDSRTTYAGEPAGTPLQFQSNPPHRILVVDDDRDLRLLYADALAGPGYHVDAAKDGAAGWEALQANRYHLLITEHEIPNLTGVELVKKRRAARMALPVSWPPEDCPSRNWPETRRSNWQPRWQNPLPLMRCWTR
jgi:hypothetical protein